MSVISRLAPSPTGLLHIGHARTFLLAWWSARSQGGEVLLRHEDLDTERSSQEHASACEEDLEWLGLDWDGPASRQSSRSETFREAAASLAASGEAYPCVCTRAEVRAAIAAPHSDEASASYPGTCRGRFESLEHARRESGREPALRLTCPEAVVDISDALRGAVQLDPFTDFGDFPITSRDGHAAYHLAVVLDDANQGVTEVLRADDLLSSCGPQALLQAALSLPRPNWIHVPLVLDPGGGRLAKRSDSLSISAIRSAGVDPRQLVRWLSQSCGLGDLGAVTPGEALPHYALSKIPLNPCVLPIDLVERLSRAEMP
jgi:glutamyl-tRNA synthetase